MSEPPQEKKQPSTLFSLRRLKDIAPLTIPASPSYVVCYSLRESTALDRNLVDWINDARFPFSMSMDRPESSLVYPLIHQRCFDKIVVALPTENLRALFVAAVLANAEQLELEAKLSRHRALVVRIKGRCTIVVCSKLHQAQKERALVIDVISTKSGNFIARFTALS